MQYSSNSLYVPKDLLRSPVFKSLSKSSMLFYWELRLRCKVHKPRGKSRRFQEWPIDNNGELILTYRETRILFGFSRQTHTNVVDELLQKGLIFIGHAGGGLAGDATRYGISNYWRDWGGADFKIEVRVCDLRRKGRAQNLKQTLTR